jgi:hypothetical protein
MVSFQDGSLAEYSADGNLLELIPSSSASPDSVALSPNWIKGGANATLFLTSMSKPQHEKLFQNSSQEWVFCPGTTVDLDKGIMLPDLTADCQRLLDTSQPFCGHTKFC